MKGQPVGTNLSRRARQAGIAGVTAAAAIAVLPHSAQAANIEVKNTKASGKGSLATAIKAANRDADPDRITFDRRLRGTVPLKGKTMIQNPLKIAGDGYGVEDKSSFRRVRIKGSGKGANLTFKLDDGANQPSELRGLYLERVRVVGRLKRERTRLRIRDSYLSGDGMDGTGVSNQSYRQYNDGNLELFRSTVTGFGQGVLATQTTVDIEDSVITGNTEGGGVEANFYGDADVVGSTISGNVSRDEDGKGVPAAGAGVRAYYSSNVDIINSTIVGNRAIGPASYGGGVAGHGNVTNSTIAGNQAETGGGVALYSDNDASAVVNTIIAGNTSTTPGIGEDCAPLGGSGPVSRGGNLIESPGDCALEPTDIFGVDPLLSPLRDNGGSTPTMALKAGSPAIGLAVAKFAPKLDQRGVKRGKNPDSGAYQKG